MIYTGDIDQTLDQILEKVRLQIFNFLKIVILLFKFENYIFALSPKKYHFSDEVEFHGREIRTNKFFRKSNTEFMSFFRFEFQPKAKKFMPKSR